MSLAAAAHGAAQRLRRRAGRPVRIDADDSVVRGRRQRLERAISNLLENAAKFDDGAEPIEVHICQGTITVSDRGPGIPADDAARVFDRFYRAGTARRLPGSGLGLAIVREVAEAHGGAVFARARPGGGAAVGFTVDGSRLSHRSMVHRDDDLAHLVAGLQVTVRCDDLVQAEDPVHDGLEGAAPQAGGDERRGPA